MANNCNLIKKGDVLWVPYRRDPLWPALVQNVYPKKVTYLFFPLPDGENAAIRSLTFSCHPKATYAFLVDEELPKNSNKDLKAAYSSACSYLNEKGLKRGSIIDGRDEWRDNGSPEILENTPETMPEVNNISDEPIREEIVETEEVIIEKQDEVKRKLSSSSEERANLKISQLKSKKRKLNTELEERKVKLKEEVSTLPVPILLKTHVTISPAASPPFSDVSSIRAPTDTRERTPSVSTFNSDRAPSTSSACSSGSNGNTATVPQSQKRPYSAPKSLPNTPRPSGKVSNLALPSSISAKLQFRNRTTSTSIENTSRDMMAMINENLETWFKQIWESNRVQFYKQPDRDLLSISFKNNQYLLPEDFDQLVERIVGMVRKRNSSLSLVIALHLTATILLPYVIVSCWSKYKSIPFEIALKMYNTSVNVMHGYTINSNCALEELCRVACRERDSISEET